VKENNEHKFRSIAESPTKLSYEMVFARNLEDSQDFDPDEKILRSDLQRVLENKDHEFDVKLSLEKIRTHEQSFIRGLEEGEQIARERFESQIKPLQDALEEANQTVQNLMEELKPYLATLVFDLAEKVLEHPVQSEEMQQRVKKEINALLSEVDSNLKIRIDISAFDYELITSVVEARDHQDKIEVNPDPGLNSGEYRIETASELIVKQFRKVLNDYRQRLAVTGEEAEDET
jgi:flagellar biosynthesis/type III secretory pathway protein FliH